jgi:hypothetical protein
MPNRSLSARNFEENMRRFTVFNFIEENLNAWHDFDCGLASDVARCVAQLASQQELGLLPKRRDKLGFGRFIRPAAHGPRLITNAEKEA